MIPYDAILNNITLVVIFAISFTALLVNGLLLYVLFLVRENKRLNGIQFMVLIAFADIVSALLSAMMCLVGIIYGHDNLLASRWYCPILSSGNFYGGGVCGVVLSILAIERFLLICLDKELSRKLAWSFCAIILVGYGMLLSVHSIHGTYMLDYTYVFCIPLESSVAKYANIAGRCICAIPFFVLTVCYVGIFVFCYRQQRSEVTLLPRKAYLHALCFMGFYFICYLPKFISTVWIIYNDRLPKTIAIMIPFCMLFTMVLNPVLVLFLNCEVKVKILGMLRARSNLKSSTKSNDYMFT